MTKKDLMFLELKQRQELVDQLKLYLSDPTHKMPVSRRQFLGSGLLSIATYASIPTFFQLYSKTAWAQQVECASQEANLPAFINIQLAGGPALFANHLVRGPGGDDRFQYGKLGVGSAPGVETLFSNQAPFWAENGDGRGSSMIKEIKERLGSNNADILQNAAFIAMAAESVDDRFDNPHDISGFMHQAGLEGSVMPFLIGGNQKMLFKKSVYDVPNHLKASSADALESSLGFKGRLGTFSNRAQDNFSIQQKLVEVIENLSKKQVEDLIQSPSQEKFAKLASCAAQKNSQVIKQQTAVDIYNGDFSQLAAIWRLDQSNKLNPALRQAALAVSTCLRGLSGSATVALGGYDYHLGRSRSIADSKDKEAGTFIARTLLTAKALNRKLFLYISADGSVRSPNDAGADSTVNWLGDYFKRGMNYIIAYDPAGPVEAQPFSMNGYSDASYQLNHFVKSKEGDYVVGNDNPIGNKDSQALAAAAVFLNYLAFANRLDIIESAKLSQAKKLLADSTPSGADSFYDYYLRIAT